MLGWLHTHALRYARQRPGAGNVLPPRGAARASIERSRPRRYLATVARRLLIDDVRRHRAEHCFLEAFRLDMGNHAQPGPDRIAEAVHQLAALAELLGELPFSVRRAFVLSRVDGLTYAEISAGFGASNSMLKQYVARAFAHCYTVAHGAPD